MAGYVAAGATALSMISSLTGGFGTQGGGNPPPAQPPPMPNFSDTSAASAGGTPSSGAGPQPTLISPILQQPMSNIQNSIPPAGNVSNTPPDPLKEEQKKKQGGMGVGI